MDLEDQPEHEARHRSGYDYGERLGAELPDPLASTYATASSSVRARLRAQAAATMAGSACAPLRHHSAVFETLDDVQCGAEPCAQRLGRADELRRALGRPDGRHQEFYRVL